MSANRRSQDRKEHDELTPADVERLHIRVAEAVKLRRRRQRRRGAALVTVVAIAGIAFALTHSLAANRSDGSPVNLATGEGPVDTRSESEMDSQIFVPHGDVSLLCGASVTPATDLGLEARLELGATTDLSEQSMAKVYLTNTTDDPIRISENTANAYVVRGDAIDSLEASPRNLIAPETTIDPDSTIDLPVNVGLRPCQNNGPGEATDGLAAVLPVVGDSGTWTLARSNIVSFETN